MIRPRFCVDWDDTLVEDRWPDQGPWLPGAVDALRELDRHGDIVIFSCRVSQYAFPSMPTPAEDVERDPVDVAISVAKMRRMLTDEGFGGVEIWQRPYKPAATVYIDNRAVRFDGDWRTTMDAVYEAIAPITVRRAHTLSKDCWCEPVVEDYREISAEMAPPVERHPSSQRFHNRLDAWGDMHDRKQRDYGSDTDPFANVRGGAQKMGLPPWVGAVIRMNDKMERLNKAAKQWIETGEITLANEGVIDSFDDMGVYAGIGATLFEEATE